MRKLFQKKFETNLIIIASFVVIAYLCIYLLYHAKSMAFIGDAQFHWQRINELHKDITEGNWLPWFANHYFSQIGSGIMSLYPYITLIPFSFLLYLSNEPLNFFYLFLFICFFMGMLISYYSSYAFNKSKSISYIFAITYSALSNNLFWQNDFGMQLAIVFLPLVIFGFLGLIRDNHWLELSIGVSLLLFSHVISTLVVLPILLIWLIFNHKQINRNKLIAIGKAVLTSIFVTSLYWMPAFNLIIHNQLMQPTNMFVDGVSIYNIIWDSLSPANYIADDQFILFTINGVAVLTLLCGPLYFKKLSSINKQIYLAGLASVIAYSSIVPWSLFTNTFLNLIQSPSRLYIVPQLLLNYIFAVVIIKYVKFNIRKDVKISSVVIAVLFFQFSIQYQQIQQHINNADPNTIINSNNDNPATKSQLFIGMGRNDYYPLATVNGKIDSYINDRSETVINKTAFTNLGDGKLTFSNNHNKTMVIPYLYYKGINYDVYLNGKPLKVSHDQNQLIMVHTVNRESGRITIKYNNVFVRLTSIITFLLGISSYLYYGFRKFLSHN